MSETERQKSDEMSELLSQEPEIFGSSNESQYESISFNDETFPIYILSNMSIKDPYIAAERRDSAFSWHEQLEIIYVLEGSLVCVSDFRRHVCRAGDIAVINPCEAHVVESNGEKARYHCLMIDPKLCGGRDDIILQKYLEPLISHKIRFQTVIDPSEKGLREQSRKIIDELIEAYSEGGAGYELAVKGNLLRLLALFFRSPEKTERKSSQKDTILPALRFIADHYTEDITLTDLAASCCMNRSYFCRCFHSITGRTAITYVNEYRLTKARALLLTTASSVSQIAAAVGFSDPGYFTRKFKQFYGVSPGMLRKER